MRFQSYGNDQICPDKHGHGKLTIVWDENRNLTFSYEGNAGPHDCIWILLQVISRILQKGLEGW